jgi:hypothetical protein
MDFITLYDGSGNSIHGRTVNYSAAVITTTLHLLNHFTYTKKHSRSLWLWMCYSFIPFHTLFLLRLVFSSTEQSRTGQHLLNRATPSCSLRILYIKWIHLYTEIFLFSKAPRPALGSIQPRIQWVPWAFQRGRGKAAGPTVDYYLPLRPPSLRMHGAVPPVPNMYPQCTQGHQLYVTCHIHERYAVITNKVFKTNT